MNGVTYSIPFTTDSFDENYTIDTFTDSKNAIHEIKYKEIFYALATSADTKSMTVSDINFAEDSRSSFGEVRHGSTKRKLKRLTGLLITN